MAHCSETRPSRRAAGIDDLDVLAGGDPPRRMLMDLGMPPWDIRVERFGPSGALPR